MGPIKGVSGLKHSFIAFLMLTVVLVAPERKYRACAS